jgi:dimethylaniline monooxygenase (N-oxide forming)
MNLVALTFARAAGVEPNLENWLDLRRALLFGALAPSCFRLEGLDALPDAPVRFARDASAFGAITSNELTERERGYWSRLPRIQSGAKGTRSRYEHRETAGELLKYPLVIPDPYG